ncbi:MAG: hypothetical protein N2C14_32495 [Planctomycetales bacterium]
MFPLNLVSYLWSDKTVRVAAAEVVLRTRDEVWREVSSQIVGMGQAEAAGYTRVRANPVVQRETSDLIESNSHLSSWIHQRIFDAAVEEVIQHAWRLASRAKRIERRGQQRLRRAA